MQRIRHLVELAYGAYAWALLGLTLLVLGILIVLLGRPAYVRPVVRSAARILFFLTGIPLSVHGLERLPDRPHLLLVNHTSFLDAIVLSALLPARPGYAFTARQQYRSQMLLWPLLKALGTIVFKNSHPPHHSHNLDRLGAALRRGENLIIFPEGGFVAEAGLKPFHSGAFVLAEEEQPPVVIAGLHGARDALRPHTWLPRRVPITLEIGAVLVPGGAHVQSPEQLSAAAREAMQPLTGERNSTA